MGRQYEIDTDFRVWIEFHQLAAAGGSEQQRMADLSSFIEALGLPPTGEALEGVLWFFTGACKEGTGGKSGAMLFDFTQDSEYIYSAFLAHYGMDLTTARLHWWQFKSLFKSLPNECQFCRIMHYRGAELKDVPKEQQQFYREMKQRYALDKGGKAAINAEAYAQSMKDYIARRYKENGMGGD